MTTRETSVRTRATGSVVMVVGLAAALAVAGCGSHGKYTKEHVSAAKVKMQGLKAATEYQMADQAFLASDLTKALKHADTSIALNDKVAKTYVLRGRILMEQGNIEESVKTFAKAEETDPKNVEAQYYQGIIAERIARYDEALGRYQKAAELDATNPQFAIATAEMMVQLGRVDDAKALLESKLTSFDHNAGIRQSLGQVAVLQSDPKKAVDYFNEARILAADDRPILEDLARAEMQAGMFGEAERHLARLLKDPTYAARRDLKHLRGQALVQVDRPVDARGVYLDLVNGDDGQSDVDAWVGLGEVALVLRDMPRVKQAAGRVIALAPDRADGYVLRALQQRQTGDLEGAELGLFKAVALTPTAKTYVLLGMVQQQLDKVTDARNSYAAAVKLDPTYEPARSLLAGHKVAGASGD